MLKSLACGAVIFRRDNGNVEFLLLQKRNSFWGFAKGRSEQGESEADTALREIFEETGIKDIQFRPGFREVLAYDVSVAGKTASKNVIMFLAEVSRVQIRISDEHVAHEWFSFEEAMNRITFTDLRRLLKKANDVITSSL